MSVALREDPMLTGGSRVKLRVDELRIGMYVSELDRPWLETPFLLQGFVIEDNDDLNKLCEYCDYVYVDNKSSTVPVGELLRGAEPRDLRRRPDVGGRHRGIQLLPERESEGDLG